MSAGLTNWLIFLVSLIACCFLLATATEWFWVTLPFLLTYLVKALDLI